MPPMAAAMAAASSSVQVTTRSTSGPWRRRAAGRPLPARRQRNAERRDGATAAAWVARTPFTSKTCRTRAAAPPRATSGSSSSWWTITTSYRSARAASSGRQRPAGRRCRGGVQGPAPQARRPTAPATAPRPPRAARARSTTSPTAARTVGSTTVPATSRSMSNDRASAASRFAWRMAPPPPSRSGTSPVTQRTRGRVTARTGRRRAAARHVCSRAATAAAPAAPVGGAEVGQLADVDLVVEEEVRRAQLEVGRPRATRERRHAVGQRRAQAQAAVVGLALVRARWPGPSRSTTAATSASGHLAVEHDLVAIAQRERATAPGPSRGPPPRPACSGRRGDPAARAAIPPPCPGGAGR